jgi:hypothetical protein
MCGITQKDKSIRIYHEVNSVNSGTFNSGQVARNTPVKGQFAKLAKPGFVLVFRIEATSARVFDEFN